MPYGSSGTYGSTPYGGSSGTPPPTAIPAVTLENYLSYPAVNLIVLAECTVGRRIDWWQQVPSMPNVWYTPETNYVTTMYSDGDLLTQVGSVAAVDATEGTWYWDRDNIYVRLDSDQDPRTITLAVQALLRFRFSNKPIVLDGSYWEPKIVGIPDLATRVDQNFTGVAQVGGGTLALANGDGYFNDKFEYQWDAGETSFLVGANVPNLTPLPFSEYRPFARHRNEGWNKGATEFFVRLREPIGKIEKQVPLEVYTLDDYPSMLASHVGRPKQWAYGEILGANPVCVDEGTRTFQVADHPVTSFDGVKVLINNVWTTVNFASTDTANAQFTLSSGDWPEEREVSVDFKGLPGSDGFVMSNPADVIEDILTRAGFTNIDPISFSRSRNRLKIGTNASTGEEIPEVSLSLYIDEIKDALEIISELTVAVRGYLIADPTGQFKFELFWPKPGEGLALIEYEQVFDISQIYHEGREVSKVIVKFANRLQEKQSQVRIAENTVSQWVRREDSAIVEEVTLPMSNGDHAKQWAYRKLVESGSPWLEYEITAPWQFILANIADFIHVKANKLGLDKCLEVLGKEWHLLDGTVTLILGDAHAWDSTNGWWIADGNVVPAKFSNDPGYAGGDPTWNGNESDDLATWKKQNSGFWTEDDGFALHDDARTRPLSRWF